MHQSEGKSVIGLGEVIIKCMFLLGKPMNMYVKYSI